MTPGRNTDSNTRSSLTRGMGTRLLAPFRRLKEIWRELRFRWLPAVAVDASPLGPMNATMLQSYLHPTAVATEWGEDSGILSSLGLPEMTGGVNPGDQRALYALVLGLRPRTILEIGTHLGCSTVSLALAAKRIGARIITCDLADVNDETRHPWLRHGSRHSPRELLRVAGCEEQVEFRVADSLDFLESTESQFDLVFLDGDHSAARVYRELPAAFRILRPGGYVVLHDYYPENRPLWPDNAPLVGPHLAVERLRNEGGRLEVLPLGELAWRTRAGSNVTSLALVARPDDPGE
jgi:predicted O-methyltransferase YrrM